MIRKIKGTVKKVKHAAGECSSLIQENLVRDCTMICNGVVTVRTTQGDELGMRLAQVGQNRRMDGTEAQGAGVLTFCEEFGNPRTKMGDGIRSFVNLALPTDEVDYRNVRRVSLGMKLSVSAQKIKFCDAITTGLSTLFFKKSVQA